MTGQSRDARAILPANIRARHISSSYAPALPAVTAGWTHPSVRALAGSSDPVRVICDRARATVAQGIDRGWTGPPYDPASLADLLGVGLAATEDVRDARTTIAPDGHFRIEFNPRRPRARVHFSIAHELAHTLFPDCAEHIRNRAAYHELLADDWQLETLCNVGAAEIVMPVGSLALSELGSLRIEHLLDLRRRYDVSMEALLNRLVRVTELPVAMFVAARVETGSPAGRYRLEYWVGSRTWTGTLRRGFLLPPTSVVANCTALGTTDRGEEAWFGQDRRLVVDCVALQPHPGAVYPRVVGLVAGRDARPAVDDLLEEVPGDALTPRRAGPVLLVHIVNDRTPNWGGRGFAQALRTRYPAVQDDFKSWATEHPDQFILGAVRTASANSRLTVASMVAQAGYGPARSPRIRYAALEHCLQEVARVARIHKATVHMPRIGTGAARGDWQVIRGLIDATLCRSAVPVIVYTPSGEPYPARAYNQPTLDLVR